MERTSGKGLEEGAIPFFELKATPIAMQLPKVFFLAVAQAICKRSIQVEVTTLPYPNNNSVIRLPTAAIPGTWLEARDRLILVWQVNAK
jgi:hypothetical protein